MRVYGGCGGDWNPHYGLETESEMPLRLLEGSLRHGESAQRAPRLVADFLRKSATTGTTGIKFGQVNHQSLTGAGDKLTSSDHEVFTLTTKGQWRMIFDPLVSLVNDPMYLSPTQIPPYLQGMEYHSPRVRELGTEPGQTHLLGAVALKCIPGRRG